MWRHFFVPDPDRQNSIFIKESKMLNQSIFLKDVFKSVNDSMYVYVTSKFCWYMYTGISYFVSKCQGFGYVFQVNTLYTIAGTENICM